MSNTFGNIFRVTTFGESHGPGVGCVIDGCPARLPLSVDDIQPMLDRRKPGAAPLASARAEADRVQILSGIENGLTLGSPIALWMTNQAADPQAYEALKNIPRPSHADFTYQQKYGIRSESGGGRASARETAARVAAGAIAGKILAVTHGIQILAYTSAVGNCRASQELEFEQTLTRAAIEASPIRCPDVTCAETMAAAIQQARENGDSLGGVVTGLCRNVPPGWGEPLFHKLHAVLGMAMLSIPAAKGFEIGDGFEAARQYGSQHNDAFCKSGEGGIAPATRHSGGIQGGISNGADIVFRVAFKPTPSIRRVQHTVDFDGHDVALSIGGQHDPCVAPRAVPVVEAMAALTLVDAMFQQQLQDSIPS